MYCQRRLRILILAVVACGMTGGCNRQPTTALDAAKKYYRSGQSEQAVSSCSQILEVDPTHSDALFLRGRAYFALGDHGHAITDFTQLIDQDPLNHEAFYYRAMAYDGLGDAESAFSDRVKARELDPTRGASYAYDAKAFLPRIQVDESTRAKSDDLRPPDPDANDRSSSISEATSGTRSEIDGSDLPLRRPRADRSISKEDFVRDAVDDFRELMSQDPITQARQQRAARAERKLEIPASLPELGLDPNEFLAPKPLVVRDAEPPKDGEPAPDSSRESRPPAPQLSTALPPAYSPFGTSADGGLNTTLGTPPYVSQPAAANAPVLPRLGSSPFNTAPYRAPTSSGMLIDTNPGLGTLHGNPIYQPGASPTLSTALPSGPQTPGQHVPTGPPLRSVPTTPPGGILPPMLPPPNPSPFLDDLP